MSKYQEYLDILKNFIFVDGSSCDQELLIEAVESLQDLIDIYESDKQIFTAVPLKVDTSTD